jgi:Protein of unknown function (DUF2855)
VGTFDAFEIDRGNLGVTRLRAADSRPPRDGEVLFEVEQFGLSANNVTYAVLGDALRYWDMFPAEPGWGRIPAWGYLRVSASRVPGIEAGRRAFGLCPMATEVILRPARAGRATFAEGSAHRAGLASAYNVYSWAEGAPSVADDLLVVLRPVFWLSFTLDDYLSRPGQAARSVIVTSASSKAAIGLAHLLARRGVPVLGLTSPRHQAFVTGLGLYDQVIPYDQAEAIPAAGAVLVDIAGNAAVRERIGSRPGSLARTIVAGLAHPAADGAGGPRSGPPPVTFFVPDVIRVLAREWGWPVLEQRFQSALAGFAREAASWLTVVRHPGLDAVEGVYRSLLSNTASSPAEAHLIVSSPPGRLRTPCASSCSSVLAGSNGKRARNRRSAAPWRRSSSRSPSPPAIWTSPSCAERSRPSPARSPSGTRAWPG